MNKYEYSTKTIYYQKARFFRKVGTNEFAYCLEPFRFFYENSNYESTLEPSNLTPDQIDRISKIAHFGFGYKNHTDSKWYAITQLLIWQTADSSGEYYFTDSLNGRRINPYEEEIREINFLIDQHSKLPSFANHTFDIVEDNELIIEDLNQVLGQFQSEENTLSMKDNQLKIDNLKKGEYTFSFSKDDKIYNKPLIFYQSLTSQNLIETGDIESINFKIKVNVFHTYLELTKIDKDTKSIIPSGEAILDGAIYGLYDEENNKIHEFSISENQDILKNIPFGKYYLKEEKAGEGYTLDKNTYEIIISKENQKISLTLENEVIKKKIIIEKLYGEENDFKKEEKISFMVKNKNGEQIDIITTDENGQAQITLPYGTYSLIQMNTTEGYEKADILTIDVYDNKEEKIELRDWKIPVPNTHTEENINLFHIIFYLLWLIR